VASWAKPKARRRLEVSRLGCSWRVVIRDGHGLTVTADFVANRVDATINHGIVTGVGVY
jgi:hypothetical protein